VVAEGFIYNAALKDISKLRKIDKMYRKVFFPHKMSQQGNHSSFSYRLFDQLKIK